VRLAIDQFDELSEAYYDLRRAQRNDADPAAGLRAVDEELRRLERRLSASDHIAGDAYSLADPSWWPWIARLPGLGADLERYPAVAAWCRRVEERPAVAAELAVI
jgi:glutathione S-transferase